MQGQTTEHRTGRRTDYRAVTLGPTKDDWAVVNERGDVVYRGYAIFAARIASRLRERAA